MTEAENRIADTLSRALAERAALPEPEPAATPAPGQDRTAAVAEVRLKAVLIEERIENLVSRQIEADRLEVSDLTYTTFGAFPHGDPDKSLAWHEGAHALYSYRFRQGITSEKHPFGADPPRGAGARAERARAQRRIEHAQQRLGQGAEHGAQRQTTKTPGIGR